MKVLFLSDVVYPYTIGGSEYRIYKLAHFLNKQGHTVRIICGKWWNGPGEMGMLRGIPIVRKLYGRRRSILEPLSYTISLFNEVMTNKERFDLIEFNMSPFLHFSLLDIIRRSNMGKSSALLATFHEVWGRYWIKYAGFMSGSIGQYIERKAARDVDHILTISDYNKRKLQAMNINAAKISVIRPGVDLAPIQKAIPASRSYDLLFAGRLVWEKRVDILIRAVAVINSRSTGRKVRAGIVGKGPMLKDLMKLSSELNISKYVEFFDGLGSGDLYSLMKSCSIFVYPAPPEGGWSIAIVEANAAGLPVLTTSESSSIGFSGEVVIDSYNGITVPDLDAVSFADRIEFLLDNQDVRDKLSRNAIQFASEHDWDKICSQTLELYNTVAMTTHSQRR